MAKFPSKPQHGQSVIKAFGDSINEIIDYLPQLEVRGDQKSTFVEHSSAGTIIHAKQNANTKNSSTEGETLSAGRYLQMITTQETSSGTVPLLHPVLNCTLSGGRYITIDEDGYINCTLSGGSGGADNDTTYIGDGNTSSGHIYVQSTGLNPHLIYSDLVHIDDLLNYDIESGNHFLQNRNLKDGAGTVIKPHYNSTGAHDQEDGQLISYVDGLEVDLNVSGGQYIRSTFYNGLGYDGDNDIASIDCLLSGSNFIKIVPVQESDGLTGGIISTNLHAGSGIAIDPSTGEITCTVEGGGGTTIVASGIQYPDYFNLSADYYQAEDGPLSGGGISFLLPVQKDKNICFYTDAGNYSAFGTFASSLGEDAERANLTNGIPYATSANGWVRLSVFDNGTHSGCCLKFTDNYYDGFGDYGWDHTTPLYRFHGLRNYSGDGSTVFVNQNGIISANVWQYTGDGTYITVNNSTKKISFTGTVGGGFKAPKYNLLRITNDPGETLSGLGTTYLIPVSSGSNVRYSGAVAVARWAPVEGSSITQGMNLTTSNQQTQDDGYVRITVIDDGVTNANTCVRVYVNDKDLPLHKYSARLGAGAGIAIENGLIRNMIQVGTGLMSTGLYSGQVLTGIAFNLSGTLPTKTSDLTNDNHYITSADIPTLSAGRYIDILTSELVEEVEVPLEHPIVNCTLSGDDRTVFISSGGIISSFEYTGVGDISVNNTNHTISYTGSGGGGGGGIYNVQIVKQQGILTASPNTRYITMTFSNLSTNTDIEYPGTTEKHFNITDYVYKYFIWEDGYGSNLRQRVLETVYDHSKYDDYSSSYGAYRGSTWETYNSSQPIAVLFCLPSGNQDTSVEVITNFGSQIYATFPDSRGVDYWGNITSGWDLTYGAWICPCYNYTVFTYEAATNIWYVMNYS